MVKNDETYLTINIPSSGLFKEKGSRFLSFAYPVREEYEIKPIMDILKKKYYGARHYCYAYKIGTVSNIVRFSDDGEPSGTAGKPILGQINSFRLTNILIVVVRYFGGILLGTGGLIQAYRAASADALSNASIIKKYIMEHYLLNFNYLNVNQVMKIVKDNELETYDIHFDTDCQMKVKIKKCEKETLINKLSTIDSLKMDFILIE